MNTQTSHSEQKQGCYSPNTAVLFILLIVIILLPFLGQRITHPVHTLHNQSLKKIYYALSEPVVQLTEQYPAAQAIPAMRAFFLTASGLADKEAWDTFFYDRTDIDDTLTPLITTGLSRMPETGSLYADRLSSLPSPFMQHDISRLPQSRFSIPPVHYSTQRPLRLLFFGDSQMHMIASGMKRALGEKSSIHIEEISVHSSGFLRSDYYNWPKKLETVLSKKDTNGKSPSYDAAVIILGMNDHQDICAADGSILQAGSEEWEDLYTVKVKKHLDTVLRYIPKIYWLGLPSVRKTAYNEKILYIDSLQTAIAQTYSDTAVIKIPLKAFVSAYGSGYVDSIQDDEGTWITLMQGDGIHYTIAGGQQLMKQFLTRLKLDYVFDDD